MLEMLRLAAEIAIPARKDTRGFWIGAVAIRNDGTIVKSKNGSVIDSARFPGHQRFPEAHAESRLLKKAGEYAVVYVSRVSKKTRMLTMARPCELCMPLLKNHKVIKCYYSISPNEYGVIDFENTDNEKIKSINKNIIF